MKTGTEKKALGKSLLDGGLSFFKGIASGINPILGGVVGAAEGVVNKVREEKETNLSSEVGGEGKVDYSRLMGTVVFLFLVILLVMGKLDLDTVKKLFSWFLDLI
jgi:hypothetical protein